jgi:hypothetical protein
MSSNDKNTKNKQSCVVIEEVVNTYFTNSSKGLMAETKHEFKGCMGYEKETEKLTVCALFPSYEEAIKGISIANALADN